MMKITNPEGVQQTRPEKIHPRKEGLGSINFNDVLKKTMEKQDLNSDVKKTARLSEPGSIKSYWDTGFQTGYIEKTSRIIDLMDTYSKSLSNPQKTLKDIEPELMEFIEEAQSLHEEYINSGSANSVLKNIMEDLLRAARLESTRFNRGDYLDSDG